MPDLWIDVDTAVIVPVNILPLIDDTDFKAIETAVVYNSAGLALTWNFVTSAGVVTGTAVTPTTAGVYDWSEPVADKGMYAIEIPASAGGTINNDTEGVGWFTGVATGVLPWRGPTIGFRRAALNDLFIDGSTASTNLEDFFDGTGYVGGTAVLKSDLTKVNGAAQTATLDTIKTDTAAILVDTGTTLDGRIPAALTANGNMKSSLMEILTTALTETLGLLAGGFKKFFNVAAPTGTVNSLADAVPGAAGGGFIAGTNAATAITTALTANVTGNLSGSVGSVTGAVGSVTVVSDKTGYSLTQAFPTNFSSLSISAAGLVDILQTAADKVWGSTVRTLSAFSTALAVSVWDVLAAAVAVASSIGLQIKTNLDAVVSTAPPTANTNADALLDRANAIETGVTPRGALRLIAAAEAGKTSGMDTGSPVIRAVGDAKTRITATTDANGNRTAVTVDTA